MKILANLFNTEMTITPPEKFSLDVMNDNMDTNSQMHLYGTFKLSNVDLTKRYEDYAYPYAEEDSEEEKIDSFLSDLEKTLKSEIAAIEKSYMKDEKDENVVGIEVDDISMEKISSEYKTVNDLKNVNMTIEMSIFYDVPRSHLEERLTGFAEKLK